MLNLLENIMADFLKYHGNIFYSAILDAIIRMTVKDQKQWMRIYACLLRDVQCAFRQQRKGPPEEDAYGVGHKWPVTT